MRGAFAFSMRLHWNTQLLYTSLQQFVDVFSWTYGDNKNDQQIIFDGVNDSVITRTFTIYALVPNQFAYISGTRIYCQRINQFGYLTFCLIG